MKKVYYLIIVLIVLSLIGVIALQVLWLKNSIEIQKEQIAHGVEVCGSDVAKELSDYINSSYIKKFTPFDIPAHSLDWIHEKPVFISKRFSVEDINRKLKDQFVKYGLSNLIYDFAIIINTNSSAYNNIELQTSRFSIHYLDSTNNKNFIFTIQYQTESNYIDLNNNYGYLCVTVHNFNEQVLSSIKMLFIGAFIFTFFIIIAFYFTIKTMLNQKKISEIKTSLMNNITHEFKTPIASISLAVEALNNEKVLSNKTQIKYFIDIIKDENKRINNHVETILQLALLEKKESPLQLVHVHVHELLREVVHFYSLQLQMRSGFISWKINATADLIMADKTHFTNVMSNLIDNAIKYSISYVLITITTYNIDQDFIVIEIEDNGIGMTPEIQKHVFDQFYRADTGNVHNVKGFGLGMSYTKTIIQKLGGTIKVESTVDIGSTFIIKLPLLHVVKSDVITK
ncbi:MAG: HAMP domain-containing sensor histidine kinase [Phycisphaerales bacterium]|nr:HAMP domain-containing sensor histidine kinase [Phycisphaerales bacterium]